MRSKLSATVPKKILLKKLSELTNDIQRYIHTVESGKRLTSRQAMLIKKFISLNTNVSTREEIRSFEPAVFWAIGGLANDLRKLYKATIAHNLDRNQQIEFLHSSGLQHIASEPRYLLSPEKIEAQGGVGAAALNQVGFYSRSYLEKLFARVRKNRRHKA